MWTCFLQIRLAINEFVYSCGWGGILLNNQIDIPKSWNTSNMNKSPVNYSFEKWNDKTDICAESYCCQLSPMKLTEDTPWFAHQWDVVCVSWLHNLIKVLNICLCFAVWWMLFDSGASKVWSIAIAHCKVPDHYGWQNIVSLTIHSIVQIHLFEINDHTHGLIWESLNLWHG